ncbi:MAG: universal stress protein [Dehalococcoidia bacterium]|nr:universal stress protein [Dehalococcoidia bacterium]
MYKKVLVPLDGSDLAECVLPHVEAVATGCGVGEVILLTIVEPVYYMIEDEGNVGINLIKVLEEREEKARHYLASAAKKLADKGVQVKTAVVRGGAAVTIPQYARENGVDLIAMATHGRSGVSKWVWGSVAEKVLRSSPVPILLVRPENCPV